MKFNIFKEMKKEQKSFCIVSAWEYVQGVNCTCLEVFEF